MKQKKKKETGLSLIEQSESGGHQRLFHFMSSMAVSLFLIIMFFELTGLKEQISFLPASVSAVAVCLLVLGIKNPKKDGWFYPGILVFLLVYVLAFRKYILEGICLFWNHFGKMWTERTGWVLEEWTTGFGIAEERLCLTAFSILIGVCISILASWLAKKTAVLAILLSVGLLAGQMMTKQEMPDSLFLFVMLAGIGLLLYSGWEKKKLSLSHVLGLCFVLLAAAVILPLASLSGIKEQAEELQEDFHVKLHEYRYETNDTTLPEGDFREFTNNQRDGLTALLVTMEQPEVMYLRGFTGAVFEKNRWTEIETDIIAENRDLLYWLGTNQFQPGAQYEKVTAWDDNELQSVTVQNVGACSRYLYVPFSLLSDGLLVPENLNTDSVLSEGKRRYLFQMVTGAAEKMPDVLEQLRNTDSETQIAYQKAENLYRQFVYEQYLRIPQEISEVLKTEWDETASVYGTLGELTPEQIQLCVKEFLSRCFSENDGTLEWELPLANAEGTEYQYATVAVMTLRYFGIPARYAEGYRITREMADSTASGETIVVDSSQAGAWAEVYQDGAGWIPMELTPGLEELSQKPDKDNVSDINENPEESEELEEELMEEPEPDGGTQVMVAQILKKHYLLVVIVILMIFLSIWGRRKLILKRRESRFYQDNRKEASAWIFAHVIKILDKNGFHLENGSVSSLYEPLKEHYGEKYAELMKNNIEVNGRAIFSSHSIKEEEWKNMLLLHRETIQYVKINTKWHKRIIMKWVECLY
ncbi:MAG: hypothetical protein E7253_08540 [Lachnospiraceae bacterium]|nr:hypothetical protein [Lachnospiraceae bacterium]